MPQPGYVALFPYGAWSWVAYSSPSRDSKRRREGKQGTQQALNTQWALKIQTGCGLLRTKIYLGYNAGSAPGGAIGTIPGSNEPTLGMAG